MKGAYGKLWADSEPVAWGVWTEQFELGLDVWFERQPGSGDRTESETENESEKTIAGERLLS